MKNWKTYKLGELIEINKNSITKDFRFDIIEYLDTSSVTENRFAELQVIKLSDAPSRAKRIVKNDDIVYSTVRPNQKHFGIVKNAKPNTIASTGFAVITPTKIDPNFLYYYLAQNEIVGFLNGVAESNTTTFPAFNASLLETIDVTIPDSLKTQQSIASILSSLDNKIELNLQMNQTLEAIAQAIFKEWFVNFNFPGFDGRLVDELPKGWRLGKLGEVIINFDSKRIPLSSMQRAERKGQYRYYGAASIVDYVDDYIFDGTYLLFGEDGTVITNDGFPVLQYVNGKFWVNNHTHVLQGNSPISTEFIYLLLKEMPINHIVTGAVQPKINQGNLNSIECIIPSENILSEFDFLIKPFFEKRMQIEDENKTLTQLRDSLLPQLMTGQIEVNA